MSKRIRWRVTLAAGIVYVLVVGLMTLPASLHLSRRLIGSNVDNWIFYWNNWWLGQAIREGHEWLLTPYLFYPQKTSLVAHSNSFLNSLLALIFEPVAGPVAAYNLVFLLGLWIGAMGMFLLMYEMTHRIAAALVAGFVFAFAPYHLTQLLTHAHLGSIHWWPFYALFLRRAISGRWIRDASCAGLFAALTLWSGLQLALLLAMWTVLYVAWCFLRGMRPRARTSVSPVRLLAIVGLTGAVGLTLSAPLIMPVAKAWPRLADNAATVTESATKQTDLLAYLLPPRRHSLLGQHVAHFYKRFIVNKVASPYLGYTMIGLALLSLVARREEAGFWLFGTVFWIALAAGSVLRANGVLHPQIPLPYRAVEHLFPISAIRSPDRFNLLVTFSLSVSASLGAAYVAQRWRWALIPLGLLIIVEFLHIPLPAWELPPASPFFKQMAQDQTMYGVVDYPMGYTPAKRWLYYQTLHGKPSVEGHLSRYTRDDYDFIASQPLLRVFYQVAEQPYRLPADMFESTPTSVSALGPSLRSLQSSGVRYVLLHKPFMNPDLWTHFHRVLPAVPVYDDATLAVYDVARPLPLHYDGFPVRLTPHVALARFHVQHGDESTEWNFRILARLLAPRISPGCCLSALACQIQLVGDNGSVLEVPIAFFEALPEGDGAWVTGDLALAESTARLPQVLSPGRYHWALTCPGAATYTAPETLNVHADGHVTYLRHEVNVRYGDTIKLQGYRWQTAGAELQVTLRWEALENPNADYKVFVHLLNADGEIAAQYDAMPCNWQCPTGQWETGEIVRDRATVPLGGLSSGEYRVAVGLYSAETGNRLPAQGPDGERYPNNYFFLPDPFLISGGDN